MGGGERYDAVIVGGGHNGLVAGFYLARAGLQPLVLERREIVGGCCVTEEFAPGFRASTGAYVVSMLREPVWRDMRLAERGILIDPAGPSLYGFPGGERLLLGESIPASQDEIRRFSAADARALPVFEAALGRLAEVVGPLMDMTPPDPARVRPGDLPALLRLAGTARRHRARINDALYLFATSCTQYLGEFFESEVVKAAMGWHAINDSIAGPSTPGTAYVLLHDHAAEQAGGGLRSWGFVRGGIGRVTAAMADAAREAGAEVRTGAEVERVVVEGGRATGVELVDGTVIGAARVLSNADPLRTFFDLVGAERLPAGYVASLRNYRCEGTSVKINLAVDRLPEVVGMPPGREPYLGGIMEFGGFIAAMDRAQHEARSGMLGTDPHVEACIPTFHDPSLAPEGKHVITIDVNSQPYTLAPGQGTWDEHRDAVADRAIATLDGYMPGLADSILARQVLSPVDLESLLGISGGHALHGDMSFDQLFTLRPVRGHADYRTPIEGLYLCGAGTHPGGGVSGANGRNCAREVLRDARSPAGRLRARAARRS
ncbi:MAG: NAD(P)/FAD-dependent oxidoreductase [Acidobacteria bacterium]|nr:MAG: NAD(P)/FAD-dependent oxidoreductase [Acidobacteriota bacterium]